jgi:hypothetical protein
VLAALMAAAVAVGMLVDEGPENEEPAGSVVVVMMGVAYAESTVFRGRSRTRSPFASVSSCSGSEQCREHRSEHVRSRCSPRSFVDAPV